MYIAELQGKFSIAEERKEDVLMSNVFSFFKYAKREIFLKSFLNQLGFQLETHELDNAEFIFWPTFPAGTWSIDFLAVDNRTNDFVVIELKRGRSSANVVGQVLRYMGWVKLNLCAEGQNAKGIIICHETDEALRLSVGQLPNVDVMLYEVDFRLHLVE